MAVSSLKSADGKTLTIRISDRFDFNVHNDLRQAYETGGRGIQRFVIDLRETTYMDSSALGMLLQLKDHAGGSRSAVHITNAKAGILDILSVAKFDQLVTID